MIRASICGASGYTGGELLRLLLGHPDVEVAQVSSERLAGRHVHHAHPNLRKRCTLKFVAAAELEPCEVLFTCLPHGEAMRRIGELERLAPRIIDLSADFRLRDPQAYREWYGIEHPCPERLAEFACGIAELGRERLSGAARVACAGCNATATLLALAPLARRGLLREVVVEVKVGSSEAGNQAGPASHHPERSGALRSYRPTGHRHVAEIEQQLAGVTVHLSATAVERVRGVLATCHCFLAEPLEERALWGIYREAYADEPFVRIVKERGGIHRYPDPKLLAGSNFCDVGFERDRRSTRLVVMSAIDNLMKGAAGQAVQALNCALGLPETRGLEFTGLHPA